MKILSLLFTLMSFQTRKTLVHLQNTNGDLFDEILSNLCSSIDSYATTTLTLRF